MAKKKKLLIIARDTINTGGGYVIEQLVLYLKKDFDEITIFCDYKNPNIDNLNINQITTLYGDRLYNFKAKNKILKIIRHFLQILFFTLSSLSLKKNKYKEYVILDSNNEGLVSDISLTHDVFTFSYLKDIKKNKIKIYRILNPVLFLKIIKEIYVLNKKSTKSIIAISKETLNEINKISIFKKNKTVIGHGVDIQKFYPLESMVSRYQLRNKYKIPNNSFVLLLSGHEYERKGLKYAIESLQYLSNDVILVVTGNGDIEEYKNLSKKLNLEKRIFFLGLVDSILEVYWLSNLFVLPTSYEGWGLVATEAMGTGLPVLICNIGGVKDYLVDGFNGLEIKRDGKDIARKVKLLKDNNKEYNFIKANAIKTAQKYSWEKVAKKYKKEIEEVWEKKYA